MRYTTDMESPYEHPLVKAEGREREQIDDIISFVKERGMTGAELGVAYEIAMGIPPEPKEGEGPARSDVYELAKKLDDHMKNGLAVNRIQELIQTKADYESTPHTYDALIDTLHITDKEKNVLRSIVERKRSGTLMILDPKTRGELGRIDVSFNESSGFEQNDVAGKLIVLLAQWRDTPVEILFST